MATQLLQGHHHCITKNNVDEYFCPEWDLNQLFQNVIELTVLCVRFQVLTAASMTMPVFWVVAPCSLVEVYRRFRGVCCLHH
jgi:hypothetical protein